MTVQVYQLENTLSYMSRERLSGTYRTEDLVIMHYGEIFKVREIARATKETAKELGLNPGQMYLVIN